ncbi:MAG: EAL domain-containing response regulator [Gemmatimonadaceae bacterium]|nr:EAL domain-containing response regulator [Gemmatimonadaceae bacterium]
MTVATLDANPDQQLRFSTLRVLVVDDQEHVRKWIRRTLGQFEVTRVSEAEDGRSALALVTEPGAEFDVIICDLKMPNIDGVEFLRALSAVRAQAAVIISTMEGDRVLETSAMFASELGLRVLGTVAKPLNADKLRPLLLAAVEESRADAPAPPHISHDTLRRLLTEGKLQVLYQPIIGMKSGDFTGVEALVRWSHPAHGLVGPDVFTGICEESDTLGEWLLATSLREVLAFAGRWSTGGQPIHVSINVHAKAFDRVDLPERLLAEVQAAGVEATQVTLELTERSIANDALRMLDVATRLRLKGFSLAIDDFGTGHSGLTQLRRLPFDVLKIDKQFANGAAQSPSKRSVAEASIALARNLGMTSVAEGVQQRDDWDLLQSLGCDRMQGYFIAKPMPEEGLAAWAAHWTLHQPAGAKR